MKNHSIVAVVTVLGSVIAAADAGITVLQNGVSPTPTYSGGRDTWISNENWERGRDYGKAVTLRCGGQRRILIRFDLAPLPTGHVIHRAILALADTGYPRKSQGAWAMSMLCRSLNRSWQDSANWLEHTRTDYKAKDAGDWQVAGGDIDLKTDFGLGAKGLIATTAPADGPRGHVHRLDVTSVVRLWHAEKRANHGLVLEAPPKGHGPQVASCEWYVPGYRPKLVIDHGPAGSKPTGLKSTPPAPADVPLHSISATPDAAKASGQYAVVHVGQASSCDLRGKSTDAYVKEAVGRFPGPWGWMTMGRIGGVAGDFSRALLYFDLRDIPKQASIKQAKLHLSLVGETSTQVAAYRYGAFLLKLPDTPGWDAQHATAARRMADKAWPGGSVVAASNGSPLAIGKVIAKDMEYRGRKRRVNAAIEFDITGAVRAWVRGKTPNCGIVLDNRIEGGAYDFHSCRSFSPELRPRLEITLSPAVTKRPAPMVVRPAAPAGNYWVEPMRAVHGRFRGKAGTLAQYGDSITVTMAFLASYSWSGKIEPKNCPPAVRREMDVLARYANLKLWREWKGGQWGNTGMMMSNWLIDNIDAWQKKMNPEVAVIMFGTNDLGRIRPPQYTENMAAALRRMMADGTVPMLTSIPPAARGGARDYWLASLSIAHGLRVPLIDYYGEIMRRRPDDWNGRLDKFKDYKGYDVPTLVSRDGTHPSNPRKYLNDFSEPALSASGYGLRDYMTLRTYSQVVTEVLRPESLPKTPSGW